jgi:hypothetical protein
MEKMKASAVREIVRRKRKEYQKATKGEKMRMLDDVQTLTGYHRKSLIRLFVEDPKLKKQPVKRPPRGSKYETIRPKLKVLWATGFYACGKRLSPFLPELLCVMKRCGEMVVTPKEQTLLTSISAATIDRMLMPERKSMDVKGRTLTKPGTLLRSKIPIRTFADWTENEPGFLEIDLVGHCGGSGAGEFLYTLDMTDVFSGWTVLAGTKGRGEKGTLSAVKWASGYLPFAVKGIDSDNDSAFINHHLNKYCGQEQITFTRSREYKKNDQCHVEQKNWSVVRQFIGYRRFETDEELAVLREVYPLIMRYHNYFSPMMRLTEKKREGSKVTKKYSVATTPYRRLIEANGYIDQAAKDAMTSQYESLNPAELLRQIRSHLRRLESIADRRLKTGNP